MCSSAKVILVFTILVGVVAALSKLHAISSGKAALRRVVRGCVAVEFFALSSKCVLFGRSGALWVCAIALLPLTCRGFSPFSLSPPPDFPFIPFFLNCGGESSCVRLSRRRVIQLHIRLSFGDFCHHRLDFSNDIFRIRELFAQRKSPWCRQVALHLHSRKSWSCIKSFRSTSARETFSWLPHDLIKLFSKLRPL